METINIAKLKQSLSEVVRRVRGGERFTIYDRKTPVAVLTAVDENSVNIYSAVSKSLTAPQGLTRSLKVDVVAMLREDRNRR